MPMEITSPPASGTPLTTPNNTTGNITMTSTVGTTVTFNGTAEDLHNTTASPVPHRDHDSDFPMSTPIALGLVAGTLLAVAIVLFLYLYKKGQIQLSCNPIIKYVRIRKRTSSMSSSRGLTGSDATFIIDRPRPGPDRELFSIGDQDGDADRRRPASLVRHGTEEDYFYDEIFERSAFVDENTNRTNKQLTVDNDDELVRGVLDELEVELSIPDLQFRRSAHR